MLEESTWERSVLESMQARHKADKVVYDQRKFDEEKKLTYLRKQLRIYRREGVEINESEDRTVKVYDKLAAEIEREKNERDMHINNLMDMIEEKEDLIMNNTMRQGELGQIAERAIQDKNIDEKHWRKIFLTHLFVNRMLRNKIDKEMQKFSVVEQAFLEIKTATVSFVTFRGSMMHRLW